MTPMYRTRLLACVTLLPLLAACGPDNPLKVNLRGVQITVPRQLPPAVIAVVPPPVAPVPAPVVLPPLPELPPLAPAPLASPPTAPPPPACPTADQLAVPAQQATVLVKSRPGDAAYNLKQGGKYTVTSAAETTQSVLPTSTSRTVKALTPPTSTVGQRVDAWSVTETDGKSASVATFVLFQPSSSPQATPAGIYLSGLRWDDDVRGDLTFQPLGGGLLIFPLPAQQTTTPFAASQTDPASQTVVTLTGQVPGKKRVDLCGAVVDSFSLALTGTITTPTQQLTVTWNQQIATQFGGLSVEDSLTLSGSNSASSVGARLDWQQTTRYTRVPDDPASTP
ncbi:MAG: hypothetical protein JJD92_15570 [Frankiaceae bacterium]|nr:hypothetical protein [Frankiaceae bacterium]